MLQNTEKKSIVVIDKNKYRQNAMSVEKENICQA